jgi:hypothetical protein
MSRHAGAITSQAFHPPSTLRYSPLMKAAFGLHRKCDRCGYFCCLSIASDTCEPDFCVIPWCPPRRCKLCVDGPGLVSVDGHQSDRARVKVRE